jgi:hypothetical protein
MILKTATDCSRAILRANSRLPRASRAQTSTSGRAARIRSIASDAEPAIETVAPAISSSLVTNSRAIDLVVHYEYVNLVEGHAWQRLVLPRRSPEMATFLVRLRREGDEREMDSKACPVPNPIAFNANVAAMQLDKLLDDSQPEPSPPCRRVVDASPVENGRRHKAETRARCLHPYP